MPELRKSEISWHGERSPRKSRRAFIARSRVQQRMEGREKKRVLRAPRRVASRQRPRCPAGRMSTLTFDVEQFKFVTSVACGREIAEQKDR